MYGMVNQGIKDLICRKYGETIWNEICVEAGIEAAYFISLNSYPDEITYKIVGTASKKLGIEVAEILRLYGQSWLQYTAKEGYGPILDMFGENFEDCLANLNKMHGRMGLTMPHLIPPHFDFQKLCEGSYLLEYKSSRPGLDPMVSGLLVALAEKYGIQISVDLQKPDGRHLFFIKVLKAVVA